MESNLGVGSLRKGIASHGYHQVPSDCHLGSLDQMNTSDSLLCLFEHPVKQENQRFLGVGSLLRELDDGLIIF